MKAGIRLPAILRGRRRSSEEERLREEFPFDPVKQIAVIRSSVCTGEKVAGFKDREGGHFTEVMLIRSKQDEAQFRELYGLEAVKTEY
jgi:hypothetical protein